MLCYRCGSHNKDGSAQCDACGQVFTQSLRAGANGAKKSVKQAPPKSAPYAPGDKITPRYEVQALLGHGPSGYVYRVTDRDAPAGADRDVALKVVHPRLLQTAVDKGVFQRALTRARKMAHPSICRVYQEGEDSGRLFFTMQALAGLPLSRIIELRQSEKAFSLAECEPLIAQVAQALDYSHRFMAHGALKPQNIIVQPDEVKVTDFMMMRGLPRRPYLAALGEALHYVAPELRSDGTDVLPAADVFSLGVVLTEMLTGTRPETIKGRIEIPDTAPLTQATKSFLLKAMEHTPDRRWRSPNELLQALASLVDEPMSEPVVITAPLPLSKAPMVNKVPPPLPPDARGGFDDPERQGPATAATDLHAGEPEVISAPEAMESHADVRSDVGLQMNAADELSALHDIADEDPRSPLVRRREDRAQRSGASRAASIILMIGVLLAGAVVWGRTQHSPWFEKINAMVFGRAPVVVSDPLPASLPEAVPEVVLEVVPEPVSAHDQPLREPMVEQPASTLAVVEAAPIAPIVEAPPSVPPPVAEEKIEAPKEPPRSGLQAREPTVVHKVERKEKSATVIASQPSSLDASVAAPVIEAKDKFGCPHGMVFVPGGRFSMGSSPSDEYHNFSDKLLSAMDVRPFCVDRYEFPNSAGSVPMVNVSFKQAKQLCENAGKRLCAEDEWERACKGPSGTRFPYGNEFEEGTCNVGREDGGRGLRPSGASSQCRSGFGVVDMSGNVAEWTSSPMAGGDFILKGGDASHPDYASRCANRAALAGGKKTAQVGFRCCAMPE